jgi:hypothetical protein
MRDGLVRPILAGLLILEAVQSALWMAPLLPSLGVRDRTTVVLVAVRAVVSALELVAGFQLRVNRLSARPLARAALIVSAALMPLEIGWRQVPTNLDPTYRWWVVSAYLVYAAAASWWLGIHHEDHEGHAGTRGGSS